jgi:hypothetical protein
MYSSQPGEKGVPTVSRQSIRNQERLLEHAHQRSEVTFVVISNVATEPSGALAIEDHQLCHSDGIADSLLVAGNGFLGLCDGRLLPPKYVRPEPPVYRLLVWLLDILSQVKAGVKKRLIIFVRSVEILNQTQQSCPIENSKL